MKVTREGLKFFPDSIYILEESAYLNYKYKNYSNSTILCREVVTIRPNNIRSLINMGVATGRNGNWSEAMAYSGKKHYSLHSQTDIPHIKIMRCYNSQ